MLNPCIYCANYNDCELEGSMKDYCGDYCCADGFADDDYLNAIIEERRASFRNEWFAYTENNE